MLVGHVNFHAAVAVSMDHAGVPRVLNSSPDGGQFVAAAVKPMYDFLKTYTANTSRRRAKVSLFFEETKSPRKKRKAKKSDAPE